MNRQIRNLVLLTGVLATACGGVRTGAEREVTVERHWPIAEIERLKVAEVDGSVSIEATPGTEITLVAKVRGDLEPKANVDNHGYFESTVNGDTLRIGRQENRKIRFFLFDDDDIEIDYILRVPPSVSIDINTVNGRIATRGMEGETEVASVNGKIDVETPGTSELYATTVNGRVRAKFLRSFQGAKFKSVNGRIEAILPNDASFAVDLSQVNGDFEATFPLSIRSNPGSRRVSGEINGGRYDLKIVTVNGDIELMRLTGGQL